MPTDHSHWLKGTVANARVVVRIDNAMTGVYSGLMDQDITFRLHKGFNTVTFEYQPLAPDASARIDILESEHNPPIPPLASFHSADLAGGSSAPSLSNSALKPQTVTYSFNAE